MEGARGKRLDRASGVFGGQIGDGIWGVAVLALALFFFVFFGGRWEVGNGVGIAEWLGGPMVGVVYLWE